MKTEFSAYVSGFLGVLGFSLTLPATRIAVSDLDPICRVCQSFPQSVIAPGWVLSTLA